MRLIFYFITALSVVIFGVILFVTYSFITTLYGGYEIGGLYPLNYADVVGHLLCLMFSLGCLYFSIKTTKNLKKKL